ncbi:lyase family protein [Simiduia litorea]|uniref:lyase family protein n=1 Tax=Simiduia litorea TaxID=1435348 RepID=UPI0036F37873
MKDSRFPKIEVEAGVLWSEQTQRSLRNFDIGKQGFRIEFIHALVTIKRLCAVVNHARFLLSQSHLEAIAFACEEVISGKHNDQFPLRVWQTGSGTQTNMNVNEVITSLANGYLIRGKKKSVARDLPKIHPNDHVNMSQSTNDVFPSAMHIVVAQLSQTLLFKAMALLEAVLNKKEAEFCTTYTVGRTHMMDALPISVGAIISAYISQLAAARSAIEESMRFVFQLALGATAIGCGANAPSMFGRQVVERLAEYYSMPFEQHSNLYAAVSGEDALLRYSSSLKQLAAVLLKIANDTRLLGSGPRCGINEWILPANEPGSSIMPGKINPTQCKALSMVCLQVFGNDLSVSLAASSGQLQLNTYRPLIIHNVSESIELLSDAMISFAVNTVSGLALNLKQIESNMRNNLSAITLLAPKIGYDVAAKIVHTAEASRVSLEVAAESLGLFSKAQFESMLNEQLKTSFSEVKST